MRAHEGSGDKRTGDAAVTFVSNPAQAAARRSAPALFVLRLRVAAILAMLGCGPAQYMLDPTMNNVACTFIAITTSIAMLSYTMRTRRLRAAPMSCIMLLGLNVSSFSAALVIQTVTSRSLVFNLDSALEDFTALAVTQFVMIGVHWLYLQSGVLKRLRASFTRRIAEPLGLLEAPSNNQLWVFGLVGCAATMLAARGYTEGVEFGNVSGKLAVAYTPFVVAPFFIPMRAYLFGDRPAGGARALLILVAYSLLLIAVAIVNNARATFSQGFLTLGLCWLIAVLSGNLAMTRWRVMIGVMIAAACIPLFLTLSDLATAMVIARDERSNVGALELLEITLNNFQDKALIVERQHRDAIISGDEYNENYVENPILARFVYTKFVDVNMTNALTLSDGQAAELRSNTWDRVLAMLPTPILNYFRIDIDKSDLGFSSGDIYSFLARGLDLGRYTTGSELPDGLIIFGSFFWVALSILAGVQFLIYDGFSVVDAQGRFRIGAIALINLVPIFTLGVLQESVSNQVTAIVRGIPQLILLFVILQIGSAILTRPAWAARRMMRLVSRRRIA